MNILCDIECKSNVPCSGVHNSHIISKSIHKAHSTMKRSERRIYSELYKTKMHSSRMRTARSLTVSRRILCTPSATTHIPSNHTHPPSNHAHPPATTHAPSNHACPLATTHAPQQPHTHPPTPTPQQPRMPPCNHACHPSKPRTHPSLWTEFLTHASENITLPQTSFASGNYCNRLLCCSSVFSMHILRFSTGIMKKR